LSERRGGREKHDRDILIIFSSFRATAILAVGMLGLCTYLFVFRKSAVKDENTHLISGPRDSTVDPNSPGYQALLNAMDNTASKVKKIMARDHKSDSTLKSMPYSEPQG